MLFLMMLLSLLVREQREPNDNLSSQLVDNAEAAIML
jgi:hypothetical protein